MEIDGRSPPRRGPIWPKPPWRAIDAAIAATNSEYWSEAAELWLDLAIWSESISAAAPCAAEAALRSGDFGLADQMIARARAAGDSPIWLERLVADMAPVRDARRAWFTELRDKVKPPAVSIERLLELALYRDAVFAIARNAGLNEPDTRALLVRAHYGLGEHEDVVCITGDQPVTDAIAPLVAASHAFHERRRLPIAAQRARFAAHHPAASLIEWPADP